MGQDPLGLVLATAIALVAGCVVTVLRIPRSLKAVLLVAIAFRLGGAVARYLVLTVGYNGVGDAIRYYSEGLRWAERYWQFDFSPLYESRWWRNGQWWSTQFVTFPSSIVTAVIGPNLLGSFIVFALMSLVGLIGFVTAYRRTHPGVAAAPYAALVLLFPSLWFWPSSLGKEAIAIFGLGLTVAGLFGPGRRIRLLPLLIGFFVLAAVRSELAGVVAVSVLVSQWLSFESRWTPSSVARAVVVAGITILVLRVASERVGISSFDVEGISSFIEDDPARRLGGGSGIEAVSVGVGGLAMAPLNVLFRPFPWEARSGLQMISSLELTAFWLFAWYRRRHLFAAIRQWRTDPLVRLSLVFVVVYSVALGMMLSNLGIIARQRIFLFPFLFVLLQRSTVAVPTTVRQVPRRLSGRRRPVPRPSAAGAAG